MSSLLKSLQTGLGVLLAKGGQNVKFRGVEVNALISLMDADNLQDYTTKQETSIEFRIEDIEAPPELGESVTHKEMRRGTEYTFTHKIQRVSPTGVSYRCKCECRREKLKT
jgi:hypothetical protein